MAPYFAFAIQPGTYTWDKSEFGIKFTVVGPYAFLREKISPEKKEGEVAFMREGMGKRVYASFSPLKETDLPLDKVTVEGILPPIKNTKTESVKTIELGKIPAVLIVFFYEEPGDKPVKRGSGYLIVSDLNGLRYIVCALNWAGNDPTQDKELGGIIKTLEITEVQ